MKTQSSADSMLIPTARLEPWPLPQAAITEGRPDASGRVLSRSDDARVVRGIWACTPGRFHWSWSYDETIVVTQGRATVTTGDGRRVDLEPGTMAFFERGTESVWTIHEPFRKGFHALSPEPLPF